MDKGGFRFSFGWSWKEMGFTRVFSFRGEEEEEEEDDDDDDDDDD